MMPEAVSAPKNIQAGEFGLRPEALQRPSRAAARLIPTWSSIAWIAFSTSGALGAWSWGGFRLTENRYCEHFVPRPMA